MLTITPTDRGMLLAKTTTISGLTDSFRLLVAGGSVVPLELETAGISRLATELRRLEPTLVHFVPTVFRQMAIDRDGANVLASVRVLHLGGEPVTRRDFELFQAHGRDDCLFLNNLGCTEVPSFRQSLLTKSSNFEGDLVPLRDEVPGKRLELVDPDTGDDIGLGETGEIVIDSRFMARGYWRGETGTVEAFPASPDGASRFFTGDLGQRDAAGAVIHLGRKDRLIKRLGRKIPARDGRTATARLRRGRRRGRDGGGISRRDATRGGLLRTTSSR